MKTESIGWDLTMVMICKNHRAKYFRFKKKVKARLYKYYPQLQQIQGNIKRVQKPLPKKEKLPNIQSYERQEFLMYQNTRCFLYCLVSQVIKSSIPIGTRGYWFAPDEKIIFKLSCGTMIVYYEKTIANYVEAIKWNPPNGNIIKSINHLTPC